MSIIQIQVIVTYLHTVAMVTTGLSDQTRDQKLPGSSPVWVAAVWTYNSCA